MSQKTLNTEELRRLPSIDALLQTEAAKSLRQEMGTEQLTWLARRVTDELRQEILGRNSESISPGPDVARAALLKEAEQRLVTAHESESASRMRRVINATGVILHTNLGRAPLSEAARRAVTEVLARDGETIVSRGELVEIGGDFRVPDVMAQSGTRMIEVGTTNRTRLSDYRKALSEQTRLIMRVHTSNYRIVGFTKMPSLRELTDLAHDAGLILYEDAGSGALVDFSKYEITGEPVIRASIANGADVVSFSGDKLVGGPQAGLVVGRAALIERMRSHPLYRALRADKLRYAALEATLDAYARGVSTDEVPVHRLIASSSEEIETRAEALIQRLRLAKVNGALRTETVTGESAIGGGSAPTSRLPTMLISLIHDVLTPNQIETALRHSDPPIIARIVEDRVLLDLRTVFPSQESAIEAAVLSFAS